MALFAVAQTDSLPAPSTVPLYKQYAAAIGGASPLFAGAEYEGTPPNVSGNPFLGEGGFRKAAVFVHGAAYPEAMLAYDLLRGEVVIKGFQQLSLRLEKSAVDSFLLDGRRFVHIVGEPGGLPDDYYERLVDGAIRLYARRRKTIRTAFRADDRDSIVSQTDFYIQQNNSYHRIGSEDDLKKLLAADGKMLERFWKERRLRFKADPETFLVQTLLFWAQQTK